MDTLARAVRFVDPIAAYLDNRMNPLLVRELRQLVRNRFIIVMLNLYIGLLVLVGLLNVGFTEDANQASGENLFHALAVILNIISLLVVVPYTGLITASERINDDLMFTSGLRPVSIVLGKFLNGVILSLLLFSVTLPFFTLANQLRGLDMSTAFTIIWLAFLGLHLFNAFTILVFSGIRTYVQLVVCAGLTLVAGYFCTVGFWDMFWYSSRFGSGAAMPMWEVLNFTLLALLLLAIFLAGSIANVASPNTNRALPFRLTVTTAYLLSFAIAWYCQTCHGVGIAISIWCVCVFWCLVPLTILAVCERDRLGLRIRASIPKFLPLRLAVFPFYSGAPSALAWVGLLGLGVFGVILSGAANEFPLTELGWFWRDDTLFQKVLCSMLFLFNYCVTALLMRSWFFPKAMRHQFTWLLIGFLVSVLVVGGMTAYFIVQQQEDFSTWGYDETAFAAPNPFTLIQYVMTGNGEFSAAQKGCALFWGMALVPLLLVWLFPRLRDFSPPAVALSRGEERAQSGEDSRRN